jgi:LmbE family N-acetylglucosaminyl deacetylase
MIFLSPHNDDETLFGSYTLLRHKPDVIVILRSFLEAEWDPPGPTYQVREAETAAACEILGVSYEQWEHPDSEPDWYTIEEDLAWVARKHSQAFAPWPEEGGHVHHNAIARIAEDVFETVTWYTTYTHARGRTVSRNIVTPETGWEDIKRQALACYPSQANHPRTAGGFRWSLEEYLVHP